MPSSRPPRWGWWQGAAGPGPLPTAPNPHSGLRHGPWEPPGSGVRLSEPGGGTPAGFRYQRPGRIWGWGRRVRLVPKVEVGAGVKKWGEETRGAQGIGESCRDGHPDSFFGRKNEEKPAEVITGALRAALRHGAARKKRPWEHLPAANAGGGSWGAKASSPIAPKPLKAPSRSSQGSAAAGAAVPNPVISTTLAGTAQAGSLETAPSCAQTCDFN